ncbi:bactofilin family protein [Futiania mangrovi]|uniref:Polymer-forming cytoskeletal protein n=1 Tax=Futiania mangrovi TaxID=2959716 RepID=A0A9J6PBV0_9PROT|nr:polymer-forming cytoskeletal protein [Futiania mangrovii]MCP1335686.1 polymer-forming cytoskeletal protein [Futiania mangrovii]
MSAVRNAPPSIVSADMAVHGDILSAGEVQIDGAVKGNIRCAVLTVSKSGTVEGEITAEQVMIHGRVDGRITGRKVRLTATAHMDGDVINESITIEDGAHFSGNVSNAKTVAARDAQAGDVPAAAAAPAPVARLATRDQQG